MKRALVSGGTGVTGNALVRELLAQGVAVTALVRPGSPRRSWLPEEDSRLRVVECALGAYAGAAPLVGEAPDVFFHLAWDGSRGKEKTDNRNNMPLQAANIQHAVGAVELCRAVGCPVFVGTGTQAEYGRLDVPAREDMPCSPENGYGAAKLCAGQMTRMLCHSYGIRHVWARLFSVYGPYDGTESLIDTSIRALLRGESPAYTPGEQVWDYMYSRDAARALILLAQKGRHGEIYNVASGNARPLAEYIRELHEAVAPASVPRLGAKSYAAGQLMRLEGDIGKLRKEAGFLCGVAFSTGIGEILSSKLMGQW